ncbi:phosphoribosylglycinamide formyltransferase [Bryocella elongata]|uniref:phosphoribosylglycinamide formyltransferase n=1 Tax=Bryocella elongata TaxID=863522 RepID=UPI001F474AF3|nr:phosphoribosylglycinamide formyltransferase [Bryocella elongata]
MTTSPDSTRNGTRIGILISGRGSNAMAILRAVQEGRLPGCEIAVVISNIAGAGGIEAARGAGVPAVALESKGRSRAEHEQAVTALLEKFRVDLVCLAGYMRLLSAEFTQRWGSRMLNIHPSLLPAFAGLHAQRQALEYGAQVTGCTVHFVNEVMDGGVIVLQRTCEILPEDTEDTLSARVLREEHQAYVEAIARVVSGEYEVVGRRYLKSEG